MSGRLQTSGFRPAWWLPGPHLQTLWPSLVRRRPRLALAWERLELADGDFLDLAWGPPRPGPLILVIHGLEGNLDSHYAPTTLAALAAAGFQTLFMHLRGCGPQPNRLARRYHAGASEDLAAVIERVRQVRGAPPAGAVGFSLGGNLLLKYLGEQGGAAALGAAVAVSVPFQLLDCARRLEQGLSRRYQAHLLARLRQAYRRKAAQVPMPLSPDLDRLDNFLDFDHQITAPLHGFAGVEDYYRRCSCRQFLPRIQVPTLILHAQDDPFMYPDTVPGAGELGPGVTLELSRRGGHVGFVGGALPGWGRYWLDQRIPDFFRSAGA